MQCSSCYYTKQSPFLSRWILRPALWTCLISILAYCDPQALRGKFVYDDAGTVAKNVVVIGKVPWQEAFTRDFWGALMKEPSSHKSFRPITTLSFRLNWMMAERNGMNYTEPDFTFGFHVTNVVLHGIVTGMVTEAASYVFCGDTSGDLIAQLTTGLVFGLHPVHAEAVSNITSRGEMLMSFFFLLAFLSYANQIRKLLAAGGRQRMASTWKDRLRGLAGVYLVPCLCMTMSLFSKEQGATTLITLVAYDFLQHFSSVNDYLQLLLQKDFRALCFLRRTIILAIQTLAICFLRYLLNGETSPDFIFDQNPAGFSKDRFTRVFSVSWVYCLYIFDAVFPKYLCPDWSGLSIDLIKDMTDVRIFGVLALWSFAGGCVWSLFVGLPSTATQQEKDIRRITLQAFFAFLFSPFLLSSNLLVVVGLMKADRVVYLPLFGFCLLEALLLKVVFCDPFPSGEAAVKTPSTTSTCKPISASNALDVPPPHHVRYRSGYVLYLIAMSLYCGKLHERNLAWSDPFRLWVGAFAVNKKSHHTMYNCGYELSIKQMYKEAELVLRPIGSAHVAGPSNTFIYAMVLFNLKRCDLVEKFLEEAFDVLNDNRKAGGVRNTPQALGRIESNLLVAKALCQTDITVQGKTLYQAVQADQTNEYAVNQASQLMEKVEAMRKAGLLHINSNGQMLNT